jgi:hypothetical protein
LNWQIASVETAECDKFLLSLKFSGRCCVELKHKF